MNSDYDVIVIGGGSPAGSTQLLVSSNYFNHQRVHAIHSAKNVGRDNAAELATYIVEKGKPLVVEHPVR